MPTADTAALLPASHVEPKAGAADERTLRDGRTAAPQARRIQPPAPFYNDADYYRLDLEHLFYRTWLFAGHDCEIPSCGYFTMQVGEYPILVVRGSNGEIRAFHNSCRHRGSLICTSAKGKAARLVCPYHQWSYSLDGRLMRGRRMGDDFDPHTLIAEADSCTQRRRAGVRLRSRGSA